MSANDAFTAGVRPGGLTSSTEIRLLLCYLVKNAGPITRQEIENALREEDGIVDVMAYGKRDEVVGQRIHLEAVAPGMTRRELWELCRKTLSPYQYPDDFEIVDRLPRNASGKLLRNRGERQG